MNRTIKDNRAAIAKIQQPVNMINRPTVVAATGIDAPGMMVSRTDPYFSFEVDTTGVNERSEIILFDGSQGFQLGFNASMELGVEIRGRTNDYQFILNDIVHNSSYVDTWRLQVIASGNGDGCCNSNDVAMAQFANAINVYESSKGARPKRLTTMYPDMAIHEGQFQLNITTWQFPLVLTNRTALVYQQEPNVRVIWSCYQKAEIGRHQ